MFWKSVVFKLWLTIIMLVAFVLLILTVLLLEFFENFYVEDAEMNLLNQAESVQSLVESHEDEGVSIDTVNQLMDQSTRVTIFFDEHQYWQNDTYEEYLEIEPTWFITQSDISRALSHGEQIKEISTLPNANEDIIIVGVPTHDERGAIYVYQSLNVVEETTEQTTNIILLAASIAIVLTTIFAFFLSTRITAPLIKMRKAASELARGEFHTKVPVLTYDEIGELANSFNLMRRQLNYHITALNQEKSQLSSILKSMADGVITVNRKLDVLIINPPAEQFLEQIVYENSLQKDELPEELKEYFTQVLANEVEHSTEIVVQGRSYVLVMTPLYDDSVVVGVVAIIRDMTDERQLDKLRKDFLANVSHELRTPISMMQGYSEAIVDDVAETKEEKQELAQIIYDESLRMGRLVNELLDLARMEAGHIQLNIEEVNFQDFIERVARKFTNISTEQNIEFDVHVSIENQLVNIDPDRIEQVLTNLIDNAFRHTDVGGFVKVNVSKQNEDLVVEVQDNGSGISEEDLPFVFERFYKSDKARTRNQSKKGTGLGLSIAKHIVEAHDGNIYAKSKYNEGTSFTFTLPRK
ncbi:two-component system sensor histidine kinase ResE [Alkalibacillus filiformis]|uniref:histidine kinase n=1 Tax=Alkalibacillus filiformis TaxID=200990 RepID=A0ABU0DR14_9BACI|nr:ATP-binding protein [Alkalibacillus filiformis]MDQ0350888.1 two-component system sensor histidine kinase ResE [Alkalibacillus filiformis]